METLVIDLGETILGIYCGESRAYSFYRTGHFAEGQARVESAREVVTYNGSSYDLKKILKLTGKELILHGTHTDMRSICWSTRIWGRNLSDTYGMHFPEHCDVEETYEDSNKQDVYMTYRLWELWQ